MVVVAMLLALLVAVSSSTSKQLQQRQVAQQHAAQQQGVIQPSGLCWRFAFGAWTPPLDWERAGHGGNASEMSDQMRRIRDSVFAKDTNAVNNNAMFWERTSRGWTVVLFPQWWPVGVSVSFDSVLAGGNEMTGQATAFVGDASRENSRARARAVRCSG